MERTTVELASFRSSGVCLSCVLCLVCLVPVLCRVPSAGGHLEKLEDGEEDGGVGEHPV